jgi:diguanylate cyclase (GGDEF)-like protein
VEGSVGPRRFPAPYEAQFQAARRAALAEVNLTTFWIVALLVMGFSWWDWYVDPANWRSAFVIRSIGSIVILASGLVQRLTEKPDWAPMIAKVRFTAAVLAVAGALAVLDRGYLVGLAGLVAVFLAGPYIATDRRDLMVMNAIPLVATGVIMWAAGLDRFTVINSTIFILLAFATSLLLARVFEQANRSAFALAQELTREARTDALTGLRNRRALEESAETELKRCARTGMPLSVMLGDIDRFKRINDTHGHEVGDKVIKVVAEHLHAVARETDVLGRWGGEEFLLILPDTDERSAAAVAERVRMVIENGIMPAALNVTISLGVAGMEAGSVTDPSCWTGLVRRADDAMYRAKAAGRNRVVAAGPEKPDG